jgi:hypothetical protein
VAASMGCKRDVNMRHRMCLRDALSVMFHDDRFTGHTAELRGHKDPRTVTSVGTGTGTRTSLATSHFLCTRTCGTCTVTDKSDDRADSPSY